VSRSAADHGALLIAVAGRHGESAPGSRTPVVVAGRPYLDALSRAGALGAVLGPEPVDDRTAAAWLRRFDGLLLVGGGDVDPARYGQVPLPETRGVDDLRDQFELALVRGALAIGLPTLAVCRGMQVLNVACGGSLHQHITDDETTVRHLGHLHEVAVASGSRLAGVVGAGLRACASMHHQAVARLGAGLVVSARAPDGTVEAIEHEERPWVVGVQWHPEDTAADDPAQQRLFAGFAAAARRAAGGDRRA
jgi:putative glutamine amidotransferase